MDDIKLNYSDSSLTLDEKSTKSPESRQQVASSWLEFLRTTKLQILNRALDLKAPTENRKVAVYNSRRIAFYHILIHAFPLAGAIILLALNFTNFYIGPNFSYSTTLQFVAKFHELLMQASISEILCCIIRTQVIQDYVPLGALAAMLQNYQISYLWSLEFFAAVRGFTGKSKITFILTIPVLVFLVAVVGPSSAAAMIPRPNKLRTVNSGIMYSAPLAELTSDVVNSTQDFIDMSGFNSGVMLPYNGARKGPAVTYQSTLNTDYSSRPRICRFATTLRGATIEEGMLSTTATIPTRRSVTDIISSGWNEFFSYTNITVLARLPQPVVVTRCTNTRGFTFDMTYFQDDGINKATLATTFKDLAVAKFDPDQIETYRIDALPPLWLPSPEPGSSSLIAIIPSFQYTAPIEWKGAELIYPEPYTLSEMFTDECRNLTKGCLWINVCTISAFWVSLEVEQFRDDETRTMITRAHTLPDVGFDNPHSHFNSPITMDLGGIPYFNSPNFTNELTTGLSQALAYMIVTTLAEIPSTTKTKLYINASSEDATEYPVTARQYGFSYGTSTASIQLALTVLITYCVFTSAYLLYIMISGSTSTAWDSTIEFVLLGLQSKRQDHLGYTSVGVNSVKTYEEPVGIRVNNYDEGIELVFARDRDADGSGYSRIVSNKSY